MHSPPHILLLTTGCVQAEVVPRLVYNLKNHPRLPKPDVIVVATEPSLQFFSKKKVEKITGEKVFVFHGDGTKKIPVPHINLPEWADLIIVYPASANTLAKCAHGFTDSLVSNIVLAAPHPVYLGPTMNDAMYNNPITQKNIKILTKIGHRFIPREKTPVLVRSTGKVSEKMYVSERMVLKTCVEFLSKKRS